MVSIIMTCRLDDTLLALNGFPEIWTSGDDHLIAVSHHYLINVRIEAWLMRGFFLFLHR